MGPLKIGELTIKPTMLTTGATSNQMFVFSGALDTNLYTDITSNKNWMNVGAQMYDYLFCRNQVMTWTAINSAALGGFSALTQTDKEVAACNYAVGATERASVYSDAELSSYWGDFIGKAKISRESRWVAAKAYISYILPMPDSIDLAKSTNSLSNEYKTYGIESFADDGTDGLFDWLENTNSFSGGTGYNGKSYWTQEHQDKMMEILKDGLY